MKIKTLGIPVLDQEKAHTFYTDILGFRTKHNIDLGGGNKWLTVESAEEEDGAEILLEPAPLHFEPSKVFQKALYEAGIPVAQVECDDIKSEYERLVNLGVKFTKEPFSVGTAMVATLDDTCGNLLMIVQVLG